jgi:hypothetical protein
LHQFGQQEAAAALYAEAELMLKDKRAPFLLLHSLRGFQYCELLLAPAEEAAWRKLQAPSSPTVSTLSARIAEVENRAKEAQRACREIFVNETALFEIALDHLTLARVTLIRAILEDDKTLEGAALESTRVEAAVDALRATGRSDLLPRGLLTAALHHHVRGEPALAEKQLAEAQQIAERGQMRLYLADVHLHRARMFRDPVELAKAAELIRELGYGRRYAELADAEAAIGLGA